jgi:D-inositol-3-phosphate glycosyltransferase
VTALSQLVQTDETYRLIIAGQPKLTSQYWQRIESLVRSLNLADYIIKHIRYIPEEHVEKYFKAADAVVLPYTCIYQSGILLIAYRFGVPVLASTVGSFPTDIREGKTGLLFRARDPADIANAIERYFRTPHLRGEENRRQIAASCVLQYSWKDVAEKTAIAYRKVLSHSGT